MAQRKKGEMQQAIDAVEYAEHKLDEALGKLSNLYECGRGSPKQRKEAEELLGELKL